MKRITPVAQIFNLLYRGFSIRQPFNLSSRWDVPGALPNTIRRYGRIKICATRKRQCLPFLIGGLALLLIGATALLPTAAEAQAIEAWVQLSDIPGHFSSHVALALDASGNVVVSGPSLSGEGLTDDWLTMKLSSAGVPLWTNRYNGPGNGVDLPSAIAADASGNVYVTGGSTGAGTDIDCTTIKYSSAGEPLWTNRYDGPAHYGDYGSAIAVDANGNVFVTGSSWNGADYDLLMIRYSSAGQPLWTKRYDGPAHGSDIAKAIAMDAGGNVFVTGYSRGSSIDDNFLTIKCSSAGVPLWTQRYNGPGEQWARAYSLAVDGGGNVIVTGCSSLAGLTTIKYSTAGVPLWTNYPYSANDPASAVAVDAHDDVYVTGESLELTSTGYNYAYATVKYSSTGALLWTNRYPGLGIKNGHNTAWALALDASGTVYVTGSSLGNGSDYDFATVAYSSAGVPLWTNRYNGPGNKRDDALQVAVDASGNVYVAGSSETIDTSHSRFVFATVKYVVPPIITRQPQSCTNAVGTAANFGVEVAGGLPLSYQWRRQGTNLVDGGNISGVTTTNLLIGNVQLADAAGYSVVVTNAYGSVTSVLAQLTVTIPPSPGRFTKLSYSPDSGFSFIFRDATVGQPYRIQRSSSLAEGSWTNWLNFTYTEPMPLTDMGAVGTSNRFYRAITP